MILQKTFTKLDEAKAEASAQSMNHRMAWVVDHVEDYQQENFIVILGESDADAPGAFVSVFINGTEHASPA